MKTKTTASATLGSEPHFHEKCMDLRPAADPPCAHSTAGRGIGGGRQCRLFRLDTALRDESLPRQPCVLLAPCARAAHAQPASAEASLRGTWSCA